jgi:GNAT superfamily N-acetyltransferase
MLLILAQTQMITSPITANDIEELKELQPDDWPDIIHHFQFYIDAPFCRPIKLVMENRIVGIGSTIEHSDTAWLGHIIVRNEYRNQGIGTEVTRVLCDRLKATRFRTISLIATALGEPVYKKLGFIKETEYHFFKKDTEFNTEYESNSIRNGAQFASEILELDRQATGEGRAALLKDHLQHSLVYIRSGKVLGFYLPSLAEGLIIASDSIGGVELSRLRLVSKPVSIVPENNISAINFFQKIT